jgi:hypothetical protein
VGCAGIWSSDNALNIFTASSSGSNVTPAKALTIEMSSGRIGIGTTSPARRLDISGSNVDTGGGIRMINTASGGRTFDLLGAATGCSVTLNCGGFNIFDATANQTRLAIDSSGNVGIGTINPTNAGGYTALSLNNTTGTLVDFMTSNTLKARLQSDGTTFYLNNLGSGPILMYTNSAERLRIDFSGNIGIGTTNPSSKLHVVGNATIAGDLTVSGNIGAKYQDIAEWVSTSGPLSASTVVVIDPDRSNSVVPSSQAYDVRVAGVVSASPGIILGEAQAGKAKIATTGRVKVRVDAGDSGIRLGDLLVTSDKEGVAMRSEAIDLGGRKIHQPGTIIGKALESLDRGEGEILVLLSLQ